MAAKKKKAATKKAATKHADRKAEASLVPVARIRDAILVVRGEKVMLDADLADLYGVPTRALNQAVKRNIARFPTRYMFQLSQEELEQWRSQVVTSNPAARMGLRRRPYAFTEHGVAMLSAVLRSERAIGVSIAIIDTFVELRRALAAHTALAKKVATLEKSSDVRFLAVFKAIKLLSQETTEVRKLVTGQGRKTKKPAVGFVRRGKDDD